MQSEDDGLVVLLAALHHAGQGVGEPLLEVRVGREDCRHEEVHERPQLHQVVLQGSARQQQSAQAVEVQQSLPALALEVLNVLGLEDGGGRKEGGREGERERGREGRDGRRDKGNERRGKKVICNTMSRRRGKTQQFQ